MARIPTLRTRIITWTEKVTTTLYLNGYAAQLVLKPGTHVVDGQQLQVPTGTTLSLDFPALFDAYGVPVYYDQRITVNSLKPTGTSGSPGVLLVHDYDQSQTPTSAPTGPRMINTAPQP